MIERENIERRHTVYQMYAESNVKLDYITHAWIGQCANSKLVTDTGSHVTLCIHLMHSLPTFDTLFSLTTCTVYSTNIHMYNGQSGYSEVLGGTIANNNCSDNNDRP